MRRRAVRLFSLALGFSVGLQFLGFVFAKQAMRPQAVGRIDKPRPIELGRFRNGLKPKEKFQLPLERMPARSVPERKRAYAACITPNGVIYPEGSARFEDCSDYDGQYMNQTSPSQRRTPGRMLLFNLSPD